MITPLIVLSLVIQVTSLNVLVFSPKFGFSHMNFMGTIADILHEEGHNVTVIQPVLVDVHGTGCHKANVIQLPYTNDTYEMGKMFEDKDLWGQIWTLDITDPRGVLAVTPQMRKLFMASLNNIFDQTDLLDSLKNTKFHVGLTETFDFSGYALFQEIGLDSIISTQTTIIYELASQAIGIPLAPSYVPAAVGVTGEGADIWNRMVNIVFTYVSYYFQKSQLEMAQDVVNIRRPGFKKIYDMVGDSHYFFTNADQTIDFPKPTLDKVIDLGGLTLKDSKPLTEKFDKLMSLREKTVLVSFGSVCLSVTMPQEIKQNLIQVFKSFPDVTFIWKYENKTSDLADGVDNVILADWLPQVDILGDERLSLFVTHGGTGSVLESAHHGVPVVTVPLFADQMRNARMAERQGFGIISKKADLASFKNFKAILQKAIYDKSYHKEAQRLKRMMANRPYTPREKLLRIIQQFEHPEDLPRLSPAGRKLTLVQYYNLDILALTIVFIIVSIYFIFTLLRFLIFSQVSVKTSSKVKKH